MVHLTDVDKGIMFKVNCVDINFYENIPFLFMYTGQHTIGICMRVTFEEKSFDNKYQYSAASVFYSSFVGAFLTKHFYILFIIHF